MHRPDPRYPCWWKDGDDLGNELKSARQFLQRVGAGGLAGYGLDGMENKATSILKNIQDLRQLIEPETVLKLHTGTEKESA